MSSWILFAFSRLLFFISSCNSRQTFLFPLILYFWGLRRFCSCAVLYNHPCCPLYVFFWSAFPLSFDKVRWSADTWFDRVASWCLAVPFYDLLCFWALNTGRTIYAIVYSRSSLINLGVHFAKTIIWLRSTFFIGKVYQNGAPLRITDIHRDTWLKLCSTKLIMVLGLALFAWARPKRFSCWLWCSLSTIGWYSAGSPFLFDCQSFCCG